MGNKINCFNKHVLWHLLADKIFVNLDKYSLFGSCLKNAPQVSQVNHLHLKSHLKHLRFYPLQIVDHILTGLPSAWGRLMIICPARNCELSICNHFVRCLHLFICTIRLFSEKGRFWGSLINWSRHRQCFCKRATTQPKMNKDACWTISWPVKSPQFVKLLCSLNHKVFKACNRNLYDWGRIQKHHMFPNFNLTETNSSLMMICWWW